MRGDAVPLVSYAVEEKDLGATLSALMLILDSGGKDLILSRQGSPDEAIVLPDSVASAVAEVVSLLAIKRRALTFFVDFEQEFGSAQVGQLLGHSTGWANHQIRSGKIAARKAGVHHKSTGAQILNAVRHGDLRGWARDQAPPYPQPAVPQAADGSKSLEPPVDRSSD